jgi:hypothetical protein
VTQQGSQPGHGWCSLRIRFDDRELALLCSAERARGAALAQQARPTVLRTALTLAKVGHKLRHALAGHSLVFEEGEVRLLLEAVQFSIDEIHKAASASDANGPTQHQAVLDAFPELVERGLWRSFGLCRELELLAQRLDGALRPT